MTFFKIVMALWPFIKELIFGKKDPLLTMHHNPTASVLAITCIVLSIICIGFMYSSFMLSQEVTRLTDCPPANVSTEVEELQKQLQTINTRLETLMKPE